MEAARVLIVQYLHAAWRRRWLGVMVAWLVCGVGWVGMYMVPNQLNPALGCLSTRMRF